MGSRDKSTRPQTVYDDMCLAVILVESVGDGGSCRLVDDAQNIKACDGIDVGVGCSCIGNSVAAFQARLCGVVGTCPLVLWPSHTLKACPVQSTDIERKRGQGVEGRVVFCVVRRRPVNDLS